LSGSKVELFLASFDSAVVGAEAHVAEACIAISAAG
jgi:hypothetical protein